MIAYHQLKCVNLLTYLRCYIHMLRQRFVLLTTSVVALLLLMIAM